MTSWGKLAAFGMLSCLSLANQDQSKGRLVSQGEYSIVTKNPREAERTVKLDHWRMYAMADGSYSVDVESAASADRLKPEEHLIFTGNMKPKGFELVVSALHDVSQTIRISCDYRSTEMRCRKEGPKSSASARIAQKMPYVFSPTAEEMIVDPSWFFQSLASVAERKTGRVTLIPGITIEDGEDENGITLKVQETEQVQYLGREKLKIVGQDVLAHKYRWLDMGAPAADLWMSDSGLILRVFRYNSTASYALTSYQGAAIP
jgi:hypothetical protein